MTSGPISVRRRWLHWRPRWRSTGDVDPTMAVEFADDPAGLLIGLVLGVVAVVALATVIPVIVIAVELVLVVLFAVGGLTGRWLFRRPWTVEAIDTATGRALATYRVHGYRRAGRVARVVQQVVDERGELPEPDDVEALGRRDDISAWPS